MTIHMRRSFRSGFTLAEVVIALLALTLLSVVTIAALSDTRTRVQDRTVEQALVQLAGDATRQASYSGAGLSVGLFASALELPTAPTVFNEVRDGSIDGSEGESAGYWSVSVLVSNEGDEAFFAVRGISHERCILGSVASNGTVLVSRARPSSDCRPDVGFVSEADGSLAPPSWREGFTPAVAPGAGLIVVGWDGSDVEVGEGASPVSSVAAFAQRESGGTVSSCSASMASPGLNDGPGGAEFSCNIVSVEPGVTYRVWLISINEDGVQSPRSPESSVTPLALPEGDVTVSGSSDGITVTWSLDPDGVVGQSSGSAGSLEQSSSGQAVEGASAKNAHLALAAPQAQLYMAGLSSAQMSSDEATSGSLTLAQSSGDLSFEVTRHRLDGPGGSILESVTFPLIPYDPLRTEYSFTNSSADGASFGVEQGAYYRYEVRIVSSSGSSSPTPMASRPVASLPQPVVRDEAVTLVTRAVGGRSRQAKVVAWEPVPGARSYVVTFNRSAAPGQAPSASQQVVVAPGDTVEGSCPAGLVCAEAPASLLARGVFTATVVASTSLPSQAALDLSDAAESDEVEAEEQPQAPSIQVTVSGNDPRIAAGDLTSDSSVRYRLMRDGARVTGPCAALGAGGVSQCVDTLAPKGRPVSYQLVAENDVFSASSDTRTVTLIGTLNAYTSNQTRNDIRVSRSAPGAGEFEIFACAAAAGRESSDCAAGVRGPSKHVSSSASNVTFVRSGAGQTGASHNSAGSLTVWSLGCDSSTTSSCPQTRFTVVARNADGAEVVRTLPMVRALAQAPPPRPAPAPQPTQPPVVVPPPAPETTQTTQIAPAPAPRPPSCADVRTCSLRCDTFQCGTVSRQVTVTRCLQIPVYQQQCRRVGTYSCLPPFGCVFVPQNVCTNVLVGTQLRCYQMPRTVTQPRYCGRCYDVCSTRRVCS